MELLQIARNNVGKAATIAIYKDRGDGFMVDFMDVVLNIFHREMIKRGEIVDIELIGESKEFTATRDGKTETFIIKRKFFEGQQMFVEIKNKSNGKTAIVKHEKIKEYL